MVAQKRYANTPTLVDYLSHSAIKLLDIHAMLLKVREDNMGENQIYCIRLIPQKNNWMR